MVILQSADSPLPVLVAMSQSIPSSPFPSRRVRGRFLVRPCPGKERGVLLFRWRICRRIIVTGNMSSLSEQQLAVSQAIGLLLDLHTR